MTEDQKKFNELFSNRGGLLDTSNLPEPSCSFFKNFETQFASIYTFLKQRYPKLPPVQFGFTFNPTLNAFAAAHGSKYYLGIHTGTILILYDVFNKMFASSDVRTQIGNPSLETKEKKTLSVRSENGALVFDPDQGNVKIVDPIRASMARYYTDTAVSFIILHEMCHIIRGHAGYLANKSGYATWSEMGLGPEQKSIGHNLWQTLEMDADSFATNHFFQLYYRNKSKLPLILKDIESFYNHWIFITYSFFRLMGFSELNYESDKLFTHPPAVLRMAMVSANLRTIFDIKNLKADGDRVMNQFGDLLSEAEQAYCSVTYFDYDPELFRRNYILGRNYSLEICLNWDKVRPLIEPFAFGDLPSLKNNDI